MNELTAGVSWMGVISGFVLSFLLGWLWYSPTLFGRQWAIAAGVSLDDDSGMTQALVTQALAIFGLAWLFGITATRDALLTIVLVLVTLILFIVSNGLFAKKDKTAIGIEAGFIFAMGVVMLICQAIF